MMTKEQDLENELSVLKEPPFAHFCGSYNGGLSITTNIVSYSNLLYSSTNVAGTDLDISTGIFTSGWPGSYTVSWNLGVDASSGDNAVWIYLRINGNQIADSMHQSYYNGISGYVYDQGGRDMIVHLDRGDTLDLYRKDCSAKIQFTIFCVSLSTFDIE